MIRINKGVEPGAWTQKKATPGFTEYEPIPALRNALLAEQGYICAYCMREIPVKDKGIKETSKIEHVQSRDDRPDLQLEYGNMVICCPGYINAEDHCDKLKNGNSVTFSLFNDYFPNTISYSTKTGDISSSNKVLNKEMEDLLNLNNEMLAANRLNALDGVRQILENKKWKKAKLQEKLEEWVNPNNNGRKKAYCGIVIWYLKIKIRQLN
jgi:uncharacterized protein (TIGR02646 family)